MINQSLIIFILLELFTIRHLRVFSKRCIFDSRNFIVSCIKQSDCYSSFRNNVNKTVFCLEPKCFSFVMSFMTYLRIVFDISK